jgi:autonomous glycyl radical cofactor GrcA
MVEKNLKYVDLSKEIVMNLIDFAQKMNIKNLIMLLDRKNKDYVKILQSMMTVGFSNDKNLSVVKITDIDYKVLKMTVSSTQQEIEEVAF